MACRLPKCAIVLAPLALSPSLALANDRVAYRVGMRIAAERGYANPDCYARVFAQHASRTNQREGRTRYAARTGRAFTGELWSRCGISR